MRSLNKFFVCFGLFLSIFIISGFSQPTPLTDTLQEAWRYLELESSEAKLGLPVVLRTSGCYIPEPPFKSHSLVDDVMARFLDPFIGDSWVGPNELFPEHAPMLYDQVLTNLRGANNVNAAARPMMPLAYVGVGFLRTWFTFMQFEDHFSDLVLVDQDAVICFCNALEKLLLRMSTSVEDYQTLMTAADVNDWIQRFKAGGEPLAWEDQHRLHIICEAHKLIRFLIKEIIKRQKAKASVDVRYTLKEVQLEAWVEGNIPDVYYQRLKEAVEGGRVHIIRECIRVQSPGLFHRLIALCEARGVRLGIIDLSNMFILSQLDNWIADRPCENFTRYIDPLDFFKFIQGLALLKTPDGRFPGVPVATPETILLGTNWHMAAMDDAKFGVSRLLSHWVLPLYEFLLCERQVFDPLLLNGFVGPTSNLIFTPRNQLLEWVRARFYPIIALRQFAGVQNRLGSALAPDQIFLMTPMEAIWTRCSEFERAARLAALISNPPEPGEEFENSFIIEENRTTVNATALTNDRLVRPPGFSSLGGGFYPASQ